MPPYANYTHLALPRKGQGLAIWSFGSEEDANVCLKRVKDAYTVYVEYNGMGIEETSMYPYPPTYYCGGKDIVFYVGADKTIDRLIKERYKAVTGFFVN